MCVCGVVGILYSQCTCVCGVVGLVQCVCGHSVCVRGGGCGAVCVVWWAWLGPGLCHMLLLAHYAAVATQTIITASHQPQPQLELSCKRFCTTSCSYYTEDTVSM